MADVLTDFSSGAMPVAPQVDSGTYRGFGSDWFNAGNIAAEDFNRDALLNEYNNQFSAAFNSREAQKARDFEEYMSNTSYQRAVADMEKAGINPLLAYSQGGASTPSASPAHVSSGSGSRSKGASAKGAEGVLLSGLLKLAAGAIGHSSSAVVSGITDLVTDSRGRVVSKSSRSYTYNKK